MAQEFSIPKHIISGKNALHEISHYLLDVGKKALIVSDPMMVKLKNVEKVIQVLESKGISYSLYTDIIGEPTDEMIVAGAKKYDEEECDFLIAIGGGSPIDAMKAIGVMVTSKMNINAFAGFEITCKLPNMIAIPTTAGTGSEATQFTIITNTRDDVKMLLKGTTLLPDFAVIDSQFTMSAPSNVTAATGLDALCHAIESYTSKKAQPLSQSFSISAIKKILKYLPIAYDNGLDEKAREQMAIASLEAGIAFNNASVTIIHGMSRPIGALYHVPHGLSNAMLMNVCLSFAMDGAITQFATLARECGITQIEDDLKAANMLLDKVNALVKHCHIMTLEEYGIEKKDFFSSIQKMAQDAIASGSPANTIRECEQKDIELLYQKLWNE